MFGESEVYRFQRQFTHIQVKIEKFKIEEKQKLTKIRYEIMKGRGTILQSGPAAINIILRLTRGSSGAGTNGNHKIYHLWLSSSIQQGEKRKGATA